MQLPGKRRHSAVQNGLVTLAVLAAGVTGIPAAVASTTTAGSGSATTARSGALVATTYRNPVSRAVGDTYADPDVVRGKDGWWYAYATSDPLRSGETTRHYIPMSKSRDLVHWTYAGDAFTAATLPTWADTAHDAALWAPDVHYVNGQWRMYYVVTETRGTPTSDAEVNDNAIGMATAPTPLGPWTDSGGPVVGPRRVAENNYLWTFDPEVVRDTDGSEHIFYGSYYGGIFEQTLDASGRHVAGDEKRIAIDNKFEGTFIKRKGGYWYLFASTANCCAGPTTGYSVEVARSRSLTGPYVDKDGLRIDVGGNTGGTPVLYQNGNRWIGTGHNSMATDDVGQDWIFYHAIDRNQPYLTGTDGINRRPMLEDRVDWVHGWPVVRYGCGPSDSRQLGPVVKRGKGHAGAVAAGKGGNSVNRFDCLEALASIGPGRLVASASDDFNGSALKPGWTALHNPAVTVAGGHLNWTVENTDLVGPSEPGGETAGVLLRRPPAGNWTVETKLTLDLGTDEIRNYQGAGLVAYVNDDLFTRLSKVAIWNTRQTEFGKEMPYAGRLSYGGTIVGPPALTTWLRIVHRINPTNGEHVLTPFTSRDGHTWTRGGSWTLPAGSDIKVGLVSQGGQGTPPPATAQFDYFHVYRP
jgi:arabinan endo-1,5-alpha-L-arabinosidase